MNEKDKSSIIKRLESRRGKKLYHSEVPDEFKEDKDIIRIERKMGHRKIDKIGFDVIRQLFFVFELVLDYNSYRREEGWRQYRRAFENFEDYYEYLDGDIYNNACYYQCDVSRITRDVDLERLYERASFVERNIDDFSYYPTEKEKTAYRDGECNKKQIQKWVQRFLECDSIESLLETIVSFRESGLLLVTDLDFFLWQYVLNDPDNTNHFDVIMQYMSTCPQEEYRMLRPLCHVYGAEKVFAAYSFRSGVKRTFQKHKRELKQYIEEIMSKAFIRKDVYFDPKIHYYVERTSLRSFFPGIVDKLYRYFETLEDLLIYRNYDLTHTDLTKDIELKYDFSKCKIDNSTKLPVANNEDFKYEIEKYYDAGRFHVWQGWYDDKDNLLKEYDHKFDFFFDFVAFLRGDLSDADLIMCRGLMNLKDISGIDFTDAMLTSGFCDKFGLKYQKTKINSSKVVSFAETQNFEIKTDVALHSSRETVALGDIYSTTRVYYMFDLHLLHKIEHAQAKSQNDVLYVVRSIVNAIVNEAGGIILLGGDVASDFNIFKLFISELRNELDNQNRHSEVFFVLGNHELWDFPHLKFESIVRKYKRLLSDYGMFLLQNEIMFLDSDGVWGRISASEIVRLSTQQIRKNLRTARIILFGGLAFSGCNKEFNAENGIYRSTISRTQEVEESLRFKELYDVVLEKIPDKRVVVFTHMPMDCWSEKVEYHKGYVYVSGHTHRNFFYDDGETRVYSDNQIGYRNNSPHLKWLALENDYDYFSDYADGVYKIPKSAYIQFYKGKNIDITFTRDVLYIYMLKKKGYYCFIYPASSGSLMMLNGGAIKKLKEKDIQYYYDHMDQVVNMIKGPLDKYSDIQRSVSAEIRKIGGSGHIHGCIIDIDWYNHVYINPHDLKITGYWASSIIDKKVYPSVTALLEKECPLLYANYTKLINGGTEQLPVLYKGNSLDVSSLPETYLSTDIYSVSYEIKKLQKLNSNILTVWYDINTQQKQIGRKRKR